MSLNGENEAYLDWMLSQLIDGELSEDQAKAVIQALSKSPRLQTKWRRWHLIRECLHREEVLIQAKKTAKHLKTADYLISEERVKKHRK